MFLHVSRKIETMIINDCAFSKYYTNNHGLSRALMAQVSQALYEIIYNLDLIKDNIFPITLN